MYYIFLFMDVNIAVVGYTISFSRKIKCSKWPEWFVKWCIWVNLVYQGRVVHNGGQIRTPDLGASHWPCPFCMDCWGILNNSGEMRSHDWAARAALRSSAMSPPLCGEGRAEPGSGTQGVWESKELFWSRTDVPMPSAAVFSTIMWAIDTQLHHS